MMHLAQWNWGGIAFVAMMIAMMALSGWATERLRRWAERPKPKPNPNPKPELLISFVPVGDGNVTVSSYADYFNYDPDGIAGPPTPRDPDLERAIFGSLAPDFHDAELVAMRAAAKEKV